MNSLIYNIAVRRAAQRPQAEPLSSADTQTRATALAKTWHRLLLFILVSIGVAAFVEVVMFPGVLVRRISMPEPDRSREVADDGEEAVVSPTAYLFTSADEKQRLTALRRNRAEQRLRTLHADLGKAILETESAGIKMKADVRAAFSINLGSIQGDIPAALVSALSKYPTGQTAWDALIRMDDRMTKAFDHAHGLHTLTAERFSGNSYLAEDAKELIAETEELNRILVEIGQSRGEIDHLLTLLQLDSAFSHSNKQKERGF